MVILAYVSLPLRSPSLELIEEPQGRSPFFDPGSQQIICFLKSSPHDFVVNVSFLKNKLSHLEVFACFKILEIKV